MNNEDENLLEDENILVEEENFAVSENMKDNKKIIVGFFVISILFIFSFVAEYISYIDESQVEDDVIDKTGVLDNHKKVDVFEEFLQSQENIKSEDSNNSQNEENKKIKKYVIEPRGYYNLPNDLRIKVTIETADDVKPYTLNITPQIPGTPFGFLSQEFKIELGEYRGIASVDISNVKEKNPTLYYTTNNLDPREYTEVAEQYIENDILYAPMIKTGYYIVRDKKFVDERLLDVTINNSSWTEEMKEYVKQFYFLYDESDSKFDLMNKEFNRNLEINPVYYIPEPGDDHVFYNMYGFQLILKNVKEEAYLVLYQNPASSNIDFDDIRVMYSVDEAKTFKEAEYEIIKENPRYEIRVTIKESGLYAICYK